jgi:hypothetical protein
MEAAGSIFATFVVLQQRTGKGAPFAAAFSRLDIGTSSRVTV